MIKTAFYDTKEYDKPSFEKYGQTHDIKFRFLETKLNEDTVELANGCDAVCVFVNDSVSAKVIERLYEMGVKLIALRSAGYNNVDCNGWQTKYMTTKWGTCNTKTGKIWINLQLAKKPFECLDYVLLHELAHLRVKDHRPEFTAILDEFMPYWRDIRKELNDSTLDYLPEAFE